MSLTVTDPAHNFGLIRLDNGITPDIKPRELGRQLVPELENKKYLQRSFPPPGQDVSQVISKITKPGLLFSYFPCDFV